MPLYDFLCRACGTRFEAYEPVGGTGTCPECGQSDAERVYAAFAGPFTVAPRGHSARRSNASRATREEQRGEEFRRGREAREQGKPPPPRKVDDTPWWRQVPGSS